MRKNPQKSRTGKRSVAARKRAALRRELRRGYKAMAQEDLDVLRDWEISFSPFTEQTKALAFLEQHPIFNGHFPECHHVKRVFRKMGKKKTRALVRVECGPWLMPDQMAMEVEKRTYPSGKYEYDPRLTCVAPMMDELFIDLANKVALLYPTDGPNILGDFKSRSATWLK